jgi:hypothetical protein
LSSTKREGFWDNKIETPYTKSYSGGPGPGKYDLDKKADDIKSKIIQEEAVHVPF